jgi:hypothetical protein
VLPAYFRYDNRIDWRDRMNHSPGGWFDLIQDQINAAQPIIYSIRYYANAGHSIVCDGWRVVDGAEQYHINYGWGGTRTAWYTVDHIYHTYDPMMEFMILDIIPNPTPVALCRDVKAEAGADCRADASVDDGSYDPEGDPITVTQSPPGPYPLGVTPVTLRVDDGRGGVDSCRANVTVVDRTAPEIMITLNHYNLWPPNHKMVKILAAVEAADACDPAPTWELTSITSNEPEDTTGDGRTEPDIDGADVGTPDTEFRLRAERGGGRLGRIYTITYTATDASGNQAAETVSVCVPHDRSDRPIASVEQVKAGDVPVDGRDQSSLNGTALGGDVGSGTGTVGSTESLHRRRAEVTALHDVCPNPLTDLATFRFSLVARERVHLRVYDIHGGLVKTVEDRVFPAGMHRAIWDGRDDCGLPVAAGIYFARFDAGAISAGEKMMLLR